jgi:hypothetical protein
LTRRYGLGGEQFAAGAGDIVIPMVTEWLE